MYYSREYKSPLGSITLVCDDNKRHIVGLWLEGQKYYMDGLDASQVIPSKSEKAVRFQIIRWIYWTRLTIGLTGILPDKIHL